MIKNTQTSKNVIIKRSIAIHSNGYAFAVFSISRPTKFIIIRRFFNRIIQIVRRIHIRSNDAVNHDCSVLKIAIQTNALAAIITDLRRIQITNAAVTAFNTLAPIFIEYTLSSLHDAPHPFMDYYNMSVSQIQDDTICEHTFDYPLQNKSIL